jgi:hypothetical protein
LSDNQQLIRLEDGHQGRFRVARFVLLSDGLESDDTRDFVAAWAQRNASAGLTWIYVGSLEEVQSGCSSEVYIVSNEKAVLGAGKSDPVPEDRDDIAAILLDVMSEPASWMTRSPSEIRIIISIDTRCSDAPQCCVGLPFAAGFKIAEAPTPYRMLKRLPNGIIFELSSSPRPQIFEFDYPLRQSSSRKSGERLGISLAPSNERKPDLSGMSWEDVERWARCQRGLATAPQLVVAALTQWCQLNIAYDDVRHELVFDEITYCKKKNCGDCGTISLGLIYLLSLAGISANLVWGGVVVGGIDERCFMLPHGWVYLPCMGYAVDPTMPLALSNVYEAVNVNSDYLYDFYTHNVDNLRFVQGYETYPPVPSFVKGPHLVWQIPMADEPNVIFDIRAGWREKK